MADPDPEPDAADATDVADPTSKYDLYVKTVQGGAFRGLFECLRELLHDCNLVWDETGCTLLTMDGARCSLVYLKLPADSFDEYRCNGKVVTGLNMSCVFKLLKTASSQDTVCMYMDSTNPHELGLTISSSDKNAVTDYKIRLLAVDSENLTIPDVKFDRVVTFPSAWFLRLTRDMQHLSDTISIESRGNVLKLSCDGSFARQETVVGEAGPGMAVTVNSATDVSGKYSLRYLTLFAKAASVANTIEIYLKQDFPLLLCYQVASLGTLKFCLAAKVTE